MKLHLEALFQYYSRNSFINYLHFCVCGGGGVEEKTDRIDEYCDTEVLRAECSDGEVLVLEKAVYGRMKIGRCVEIPMGNVGCFTDVLRLADRRCSGRRVCELRVPDAEFEASHPCLRELKTYLEASYTCIKGARYLIGSEPFSM